MPSNAAVKGDFLLPVGEGTVAGVRGVGDVEIWMIEGREEPGQIPPKGEVGTPEPLMHVPPLTLPLWTERPLLQELSPPLVPRIECCGEPIPRCVGECQGDRPKLLARCQFRSLCELLGDRLELVVLAVLNGDSRVPALQQLSHAPPAINREGREANTCSRECLEEVCVCCGTLAGNLPPVEVASFRAADEDAARPAEERGIEDGSNGVRGDDQLSRDRIVQVEVLPERFGALVVVLAQRCVGLLARGVFLVGQSNPGRQTLVTVGAEELMTADSALVQLTTSLVTVSLDAI